MYACLFYLGVLVRKNKKSRSWFYIGANIINYKEIAKIVLPLVLGVYIGYKIPDDKPELPVVEQKQNSKCEIVRVIKKDGTIVERIQAESKQEQAVNQEKKGTDSTNIYIGVSSSLNLAAAVSSGKIMLGLESNLKNDHKATIYYNILKW